ncbi:probable serine/threonine-protein kinase At1g54610 [Ziziphus jujuba]|uniref:Probable serine/threonine-protein kinase At1g54610 n=1 Tax=Ziziphus jujuba TaxID=326968 RepID=A0A6P6G9U9_ZIZJJ|nr:probable serine/threonine-protein kinase At1g54610 [Ziziphus jujuba]
MGCICSKGASEVDADDDYEEGKELNKASVQLVAPVPSKRENLVIEIGGKNIDGSVGSESTKHHGGSVHKKPNDEDSRMLQNEIPANSHHQRWATMDLETSGRRAEMSRIASIPNGVEGEQNAAGWPSWLTSVAADAIEGWLPRQADSFEKLDKIGQGTYSSVYKARDLETGKIVALKKVRFVNRDPESVRFMAREIHILRRLDHRNVMKLEGIVTSRMSCSLYLVFEYMEHDLSGLAARGIKFTEPQIKCYMQQLLCGLEHCHSRGVLHRDIKGSNLLIDNNGVLKIGDFGLATSYGQNELMTSRVVTLWYRAPELLLGATKYGPAIDLWSSGCILAELFAGKPIMPGRTEVEQTHKIFKLCGSPSEDFWETTKLPHSTSFRPQQSYTRRLADMFKDIPPPALALIDKLLSMKPDDRGSAESALGSEFFTTIPLPCEPSSLPKYPPSKEFNAKLRGEEARRRRAETVKGRGPESVRRGSRDNNAAPTPEFDSQVDVSLQEQSNAKTSRHKYVHQEGVELGFLIEPPRVARPNGYSHSSSMVHPVAEASTRSKTGSFTRNKPELSTQSSHLHQAQTGSSNSNITRGETLRNKESRMEYVSKKNRINYSGPLVPLGGNLEDMLKEHERQIQQAVRKARLDKARTNKNMDNFI